MEPVTTSEPGLNFSKARIGQSGVIRYLWVKNNQSQAVQFSSITVGGAGAGSYAISASTCGASLASHTSCQLTLVFAPQSTGPVAATLSIVDSAANSPQTVRLTGEGISPSH